MSQKGKIQLTFIIIAPPDQVAEGDRLFASHAPWMEATHHRSGDKALLSFLKTETYWRFSTETLSVVPLFLLMGQFAAKAHRCFGHEEIDQHVAALQLAPRQEGEHRQTGADRHLANLAPKVSRQVSKMAINK